MVWGETVWVESNITLSAPVAASLLTVLANAIYLHLDNPVVHPVSADTVLGWALQSHRGTCPQPLFSMLGQQLRDNLVQEGKQVHFLLPSHLQDVPQAP